MKPIRQVLGTLAFAAALAAAGCARSAPTSPDAGMAAPPAGANAGMSARHAAATPQGLVSDLQSLVVTNPLIVSVTGLLPPGLQQFVIAGSGKVLAGSETVVVGGRWTLDFHKNSLLATKNVTVSTASDGSMRVRFGPDGTIFVQPVDLTIDYSGTALDPSSKSYVPGMVPQFLYFSPALNAWVQMPCTVDARNRKLHATLQHFSDYGVGGRAGW